MSGIVGSKLNIRGSGLVGSLGTDGQHMLSAGAGKTNVFETVSAGGGAWTFISKATISDDTEIDIESGIDSTYPLYAFVFNKVRVATDHAEIYARVKVSTFQTGSNYDFHHIDCRTYTGSSWPNGNDANSAAAYIQMIHNNGQGNATTETVNLIFYLPAPADTAIHKVCWWLGTGIRDDALLTLIQGFGGYDGGAGAITGMRFYASTGNLTSGTITMYGIKDS